MQASDRWYWLECTALFDRRYLTAQTQIGACKTRVAVEGGRGLSTLVDGHARATRPYRGRRPPGQAGGLGALLL